MGVVGKEDISLYSKVHVIVMLEFPQMTKQNTNSSLVTFQGVLSHVSHNKAKKPPLEQYFTMKVPPLSVSCTTHI